MDFRRADRLIAVTAEAQFGIFNRAQALAAGHTETSIRHRRESGRWTSLQSGVFRIAGAPSTWNQKVMAAVLCAGDGAAASHRTAASLWGFPNFDREHVEICAPPGRKDIPGVTVHRTRRRFGLMDAGPITVTDPARTIFDLCAVVRPSLAEHALDDALRRRVVTLIQMREEFMRTAGQGRGGTVVMRELLENRGVGYIPPHSWLERRLLHVLLSGGLPEPVKQYPVRERGVTFAFIDLAYPASKVAVEADGYQYHFARAAWEHDRERDARLQGLGWAVLRFSKKAIEERPGWVRDQVDRALHLRAAS